MVAEAELSQRGLWSVVSLSGFLEVASDVQVGDFSVAAVFLTRKWCIPGPIPASLMAVGEVNMTMWPPQKIFNPESQG